MQFVQQGCLVKDFLLHGLLPELLAEGLGGRELFLETFALYGIALKR